MKQEFQLLGCSLRFFLEKLIVAQLIKIPLLLCNPNVSGGMQRSRHWFLYWVTRTANIPTAFSIRFNIILLSLPGSPRRCLLFRFPGKISHLSRACYMSCPSHPSFLVHVIIFDDICRQWSVLCRDTVSLMQPQVSHSYRILFVVVLHKRGEYVCVLLAVVIKRTHTWDAHLPDCSGDVTNRRISTKCGTRRSLRWKSWDSSSSG
jgi:hypothetical protein